MAAKKSGEKETEIRQVFEDAQDRLVLQSSDMSLETIAAMVQKGAIDTDPAYQRRERWSLIKQSALIESFLLNIPIPPIYLAEETYGRYSVIDGKQRVMSITRFLGDEFALTGLERFAAVNNQRFSDLPREIKNALMIRPWVRVVTLLRQSDPELKYEVFERLNTGGEALFPQEIRNSAFRGSLNNLLIDLSGNAFLRAQLKIEKNSEPAYLQMQDVEYVLRFLCMTSEWKDFSGDYRRSMDRFMAENRNPSPERLRELRNLFESSIERCKEIWGENAFKRYSGGEFRNQFLAGMFDAQMVAVSLVKNSRMSELIRNKSAISTKTRALFTAHPKFEDWVRAGTNTKSSVAGRIKAVYDMLMSV